MLVGMAALTLVGAVACGDGPKPRPVNGPPRPTETPATPAPSAADGGVVKVLESGFTDMKDPEGKPMLSYGIVVQNTSRDLVAVDTRLRIRLTDAAGQPIEDRVGGGVDVERHVAMILPGQRFGVGADTYVSRAGTAHLAVAVGDSMWLIPDTKVTPVARITADTVVTKHDQPGQKVVLSFAVRSQYKQVLDHPTAEAVFRDRTGAVVGGTPPDMTHPGDHYWPSSTIGQIDATYGIPPSTDDTRTEVYISPFNA